MRLEEAIKKHGGWDALTPYERGWLDGVQLYSYMRDGVTYVGTTGRTLGKAVDDFLTASKRREPFDSQLDYPERHTTRGVI